MKVLILGSGGREHAMAHSLAGSELVSALFVAPGNGGTAMMGGKVRNIDLKATAVEDLLDFAGKEGIGLTVVGPEQPLEAGIVDSFQSAGMKIVGPRRDAARLESSKVFSKDFMRRHNIPTAGYHVFSDRISAAAYLDSLPASGWPQVLKASGLCGGKGVIIAPDYESACSALGEMFDERVFGEAADEVVIEDFLTGQEASVFVLTDGTEYRLFLPAQDHKRIGEGDTGKNTGGMGAYAPAPVVTAEVMKKVEERVVVPTLEGMRSEGCPFTGFLYVGLMIDGGEPSVVEYNVRLGDPETQVVLPLLESDFAAALLASVDGGLRDVPFTMRSGSASTVVMASEGYPGRYPTGIAVSIDDSLKEMKECSLFHAGTVLEGERLLTAGGRVFSVTAVGSSLKESLQSAYRAVAAVHFDGAVFRRDIGARAL
ncbi:MAG: phosphoribosylamine--glycine ligase [Chlorobium sp.]|nr:phosphoribosylamine--glycine ligase [Chlorobium phaeovibrioides]NQU46620.1 phosphoribosylamine--glycine ligase [Chlorobium sp.]